MESESVLIIAALFFLRIALPLIITLAFGYVMNFLVDHWKSNVEI
jgi:hypothetical protein